MHAAAFIPPHVAPPPKPLPLIPAIAKLLDKLSAR